MKTNFRVCFKKRIFFSNESDFFHSEKVDRNDARFDPKSYHNIIHGRIKWKLKKTEYKIAQHKQIGYDCLAQLQVPADIVDDTAALNLSVFLNTPFPLLGDWNIYRYFRHSLEGLNDHLK